MMMIWKLNKTNVFRETYHAVRILFNNNLSSTNVTQRFFSVMSDVRMFRIPKKIEEKYRVIDKMSADSSLLFIHPFTKFLTWGYYAIIGIVASGSAWLFYQIKYEIESGEEGSEYPRKLQDSKGAGDYVRLNGPDDLKYLTSFMLSMNIILLFILRLHVMRIWFNSKTNKYTMRLLGEIPGLKKYVVFSPGEVKLKRQKPLTPIGEMSHKINGSTYYFSVNNFKRPIDYEKMFANEYYA